MIISKKSTYDQDEGGYPEEFLVKSMRKMFNFQKYEGTKNGVTEDDRKNLVLIIKGLQSLFKLREKTMPKRNFEEFIA